MRPSTFGENLRAERARRGLTMAQLAARVGCTPQHISMLEKDRYSPRLDLAVRIANALDVQIGSLAPSQTFDSMPRDRDAA